MQVVPGISLAPSGEVTIEPAMTPHLIDLAIRLDDASRYPVDVQHVVAAVILAVRSGELDPESRLSAADEQLCQLLLVHVEQVLAEYGDDLESGDR